MAIIISWLVLTFIVAFIAANRGRSGIGFFFLALVLSPLISLVILLCTNPKTSAQEASVRAQALSEADQKWADLVKYDPEIGAAVSQLKGYGPAAVHRFRSAYGSVNNKAAIPAIVADILTSVQKGSLAPTKPIPSGYIQKSARNGIGIYGNGRSYWVEGEFFGSMPSAEAWADKVVFG